MALAEKTENRQVAQAMTNNIKIIPGGKIFSLTNMHGQGLRLKVG